MNWWASRLVIWVRMLVWIGALKRLREVVLVAGLIDY